MLAEWILLLLYGISYGALLFILASGFTLIQGAMGIVNLAHGSLYMIGAYIGLTFVRQLEFNYFLAALLGSLAVMLIGLVIKQAFLNYLYKEPLAQVLLTCGLVFIFANVSLWIWGPFMKLGTAPSLLAGSIKIGEIAFPFFRLALIVVGLLIALGLWLFQQKTRAGAIVRAGMDDKEMTEGLGLNYGVVGTAVFCLGTFMAGLAGFLGAPIVGVHSAMGWDILILAFVVVIIGGIGSVSGALLGSMIVGLINSIGIVFFPSLAMFSIYLIAITILVIRPSGLLGRKGV